MSLKARHSALVMMIIGARKLLAAVEGDDLEELRRAVLAMKSITSWASAIEVAGAALPTAKKLLRLDLVSHGVDVGDTTPKFCDQCGMSVTMSGGACKGCAVS